MVEPNSTLLDWKACAKAQQLKGNVEKGGQLILHFFAWNAPLRTTGFVGYSQPHLVIVVYLSMCYYPSKGLNLCMSFWSPQKLGQKEQDRIWEIWQGQEKRYNSKQAWWVNKFYFYYYIDLLTHKINLYQSGLMSNLLRCTEIGIEWWT